jgi:hypothetical protein
MTHEMAAGENSDDPNVLFQAYCRSISHCVSALGDLFITVLEQFPAKLKALSTST